MTSLIEDFPAFSHTLHQAVGTKTQTKMERKHHSFLLFSVQSWLDLPESLKRQHRVSDCPPCKTTHVLESSLHEKFMHKSSSNLLSQTDDVIDSAKQAEGTIKQNFNDYTKTFNKL